MKKITPIQQAMNLLDCTEQSILRENLEVLNPQAQEDLCLALVAYKRFRIPRTFPNNLLQVIYTSFVELLNKRQLV